jgi:hypothetical protein
VTACCLLAAIGLLALPAAAWTATFLAVLIGSLAATTPVPALERDYVRATQAAPTNCAGASIDALRAERYVLLAA